MDLNCLYLANNNTVGVMAMQNLSDGFNAFSVIKNTAEMSHISKTQFLLET